MKINWKLRVKSLSFWTGIIPLIAILVQVVGAPFGLDVSLVTGIESYIIGVVNAIFAILIFLGVVADPTTKGLSDSEQALEYTEPK